MTNKQISSILLIEPDEQLKTTIANNFIQHGFKVYLEQKGDLALSKIEELKPDVIVLELELDIGGLSGIGVCTILRSKLATKNIPIIMIANQGEEVNSIKGIDCGIDDYVIKPFQPNELSMRVKSVLQRSRPLSGNKFLEYKDLRMDINACRVTRLGREIHLGPKEFQILKCLLENPKKILSREYIMRHVWGYDAEVEIRTIDVHINRLRTALKNDVDGSPFIKTVRAAGYCLGLPGHR